MQDAFIILEYIFTQQMQKKKLTHTVAVKIVQPPVEKKLFLLQLRNESHCRFPTYLLLKLITLSVLVFSFRPKLVLFKFY